MSRCLNKWIYKCKDGGRDTNGWVNKKQEGILFNDALNSYMASGILSIWIMRKETRWRHFMDYNNYFRLATRDLLHAPSHKQYKIYHNLCYTICEKLVGTDKYIRLEVWMTHWLLLVVLLLHTNSYHSFLAYVLEFKFNWTAHDVIPGLSHDFSFWHDLNLFWSLLTVARVTVSLWQKVTKDRRYTPLA